MTESRPGIIVGRWYPRILVFLSKCIMIVGVLAAIGNFNEDQPVLVIGCAIFASIGLFLYVVGRWVTDTTEQLNTIAGHLASRGDNRHE